VNAAGEQLLSGAGFAHQKDARAPARSDFVCQPDDFTKDGAFAYYMCGPGLAKSSQPIRTRNSFDCIHRSETIRYTCGNYFHVYSSELWGNDFGTARFSLGSAHFGK
jgi:hypothetical protein